MISLKQFMEAAEYRITEGSEYGWQCFGPNAYSLDSWSGEQNGHTLSIVFDRKTQLVYQVEAFDYARDRAYRMINPEYRALFDAECREREVDDVPWEREDGTPVKFTDLDVDDDWLEKASAIAAGEEYDTRVKIPLELDRDQLHELMLLAHQQDLTLNQLVEKIVKLAVEEDAE